MKLAAAVIIAGTLLSIGFCMETSRKETAKQLQELIRFLLFAGQEIDLRRYDHRERMDRELMSFTYMHSTTMRKGRQKN